MLETTWLPAFDVPATIAPVDPGTPLAERRTVHGRLPAAGVDDLRAGLLPLADGYARWPDEREGQIGALPEPLRPWPDLAVVEDAAMRTTRAARTEATEATDAAGVGR